MVRLEIEIEYDPGEDTLRIESYAKAPVPSQSNIQEWIYARILHETLPYITDHVLRNFPGVYTSETIGVGNRTIRYDNERVSCEEIEEILYGSSS